MRVSHTNRDSLWLSALNPLASSRPTYLSPANRKVSWDVMKIRTVNEAESSLLIRVPVLVSRASGTSQHETTARSVLDTVRLAKVEDHYAGDKFYKCFDGCVLIRS